MKLNTILSLLLFGILAACGNTTSKDNVEFKAETEIPLDPIYTGKMMFGIFDLIKKVH